MQNSLAQSALVGIHLRLSVNTIFLIFASDETAHSRCVFFNFLLSIAMQASMGRKKTSVSNVNENYSKLDAICCTDCLRIEEAVSFLKTDSGLSHSGILVCDNSHLFVAVW